MFLIQGPFGYTAAPRQRLKVRFVSIADINTGQTVSVGIDE